MMDPMHRVNEFARLAGVTVKRGASGSTARLASSTTSCMKPGA